MDKIRHRTMGAAALGAVLLAWPWVLRAQAPDAPRLPTADQILAKYENFLGGAAALHKVTSRIVTYRRIEYGPTPSDNILVRYSKMPNLSIMQFRTIYNKFIQYGSGCDQTGPWSAIATGAIKPVNPDAAINDDHCGQDLYSYGYLPLDLARLKADVKGFEVKALIQMVPYQLGPGAALAGGKGGDLFLPGPRQAYLVLSVPARSTDQYAWLYFDVQSGALLRRADAGNGPVPIEPGMTHESTDFLQYRDIGDGTRAPFQYVTSGPRENRGVFTSVVDNTPIVDEDLRRPKDTLREDKGR